MTVIDLPMTNWVALLVVEGPVDLSGDDSSGFDLTNLFLLRRSRGNERVRFHC